MISEQFFFLFFGLSRPSMAKNDVRMKFFFFFFSFKKFFFECSSSIWAEMMLDRIFFFLFFDLSWPSSTRNDARMKFFYFFLFYFIFFISMFSTCFMLYSICLCAPCHVCVPSPRLCLSCHVPL